MNKKYATGTQPGLICTAPQSVEYISQLLLFFMSGEAFLPFFSSITDNG